MLEQFLCLNGVEIVNGSRTLSYLHNVGHPLLVTPPDPSCMECWSNDRTTTVCQVPYACIAGFDRSVEGEIAAQVWELYRGAEAVTEVGVVREVRTMVGCPDVRPAVPVNGWETSDYADPFTMPLLLSIDDLTTCPANTCRFERWTLYDIERWPVPSIAAATEGEGSGTVQLVFYIDPCSSIDHVDVTDDVATVIDNPDDHYGSCSVSFDGGLTWNDMQGQVTPGRASGQPAMECGCVPAGLTQFTFASTTDAAGFRHRFSYLAGGSGSFDVQVWMAPTVYATPPPATPFDASSMTVWQLVGLGLLTDGAMTAAFPDGVQHEWPAVSGTPVGWYYEFWRYTDRVTRAVYELVIAVNGLNIGEASTVWDDKVAFSLDGGATWHTPEVDDAAVLVQPPPIHDAVPIVTDTRVTTGAPFTTPAADNAPWYDPSIPESADVLGVWLEEFESPTPWKRDRREGSFGGVLPRGKLQTREVHMVGYVYTRTCAATTYAKTWLFEALAQEGCTGCDLPDALVYKGCNPLTESAEYARTIKRVGLIDHDFEVDQEFPCCLGFKFDVTLASELPHLYRDPVTVYEGPIVDLTDDPICNICSPCPAPAVAPYACGCADVSVPTVFSQSILDCYCSPAKVRRLFVPIEPAPYVWGDATLRVTVHASPNMAQVGGQTFNESLRNLKIAGYQNPLGLASPLLAGTDYFECQDPCVEIEVACLPPSADLVVDGTTRRATVSVGPASADGYGYLSSGGGGKFNWPDVGCNGLMLCIETDAVFTTPDSILKVELVPRERR